MTVVLTGFDLKVEEVVSVARDGQRAEISTAALERVARTRAIVDDALARGETVYGLSTAVGVLKRVGLGESEIADFNRSILASHRVAQGPEAPPEVVRATLLRLANGLARGTAGVRPELAEHVVAALNDRRPPPVRILGSIGQADLAAMADLAVGITDGFALAPGEGLALLNNNAFSTGWAALALADAGRLLSAMEAAGALSLEGFGANLTILHPAVGDARPYPGLAEALVRLREHLDGSRLFEPGAARNLQDPLTFRNLPQLQGAARDAFSFAGSQVGIELNAAQGNPMVVAEEGRVISVANYEVLPLSAALDTLRIGLAPALTSAGERVVKLLETPWSDLPTGLAERPETADPGLAYLGIATQAIVAEARLLAQPVSFEMASSAHAEGIEDRTTMAPLAARRTAEMVELGERVAAAELVVAAQAVDLRAGREGRSAGAGLGRGTADTYAAVREVVPFTRAREPVPQDMEPVRELVRSSRLSVPVRSSRPDR